MPSGHLDDLFLVVLVVALAGKLAISSEVLSAKPSQLHILSMFCLDRSRLVNKLLVMLSNTSEQVSWGKDQT